MDIDLSFLACGALHFTPQQSLFFGSILIAILLVWLFSIIAAFVSFCFLLNPELSNRFKAINGTILAICLLPVLSLFMRMWINDLWTAMIVGFGIPLLIVSHFIFLLHVKRRLRREHQHEHDGIG
jgi:hypothetical protein